MAEEVKKIISIEVGKSITSVRDFKKHIEDLRGALLALNENSDEYKQIAEEITNNQNKLNEVMAIGKKNTDAASGSYNALNNQLKSLRAQYKALSETERNGTTGQTILQSITKLDTQLKELDAGMGQYQRNVGNYQGAFEEAFKAVSRDIGNINPELGKLMQTASSLIPLIKKATTAATTGLKGVKAAMASTGIGLLVVALGEIVANWEKIHGWVNKVLGRQKEITGELKSSADRAKELADRYKEALDYQHRLRQAQGKTDLEIANEDIKSANEEIDKRQELNRTIDEYIDKIQQIREDIAKSNAFNFGIEASIQNQIDSLTENISGDLMALGESWGQVLEFKNKVENETSVFDMGGYLYDFQNFLKEQRQDNEIELDRYNNMLDELYKDQEVATQKYITDSENRAKAAANALKSELEQRRLKYEEDRKYAEENIKRLKDRNKALANLEAEYQADVRRIYQNSSSAAREELQRQKQEAADLYNELKNRGKTELEILDENYVEQLTLLNKFGYDTTELTKRWQEERERLVLENYQKEQDELREHEEAELKIRQDAFQKLLDEQGSQENWLIASAETADTRKDRKWYNFFGLYDGQQDIQKERDKEDAIFQIQQQGYMDRIDLHQQYLQNLEEGSEEYMNTVRAINDEKLNLAYHEYEYQEKLNDRILSDAEEKRDALNKIVEASISIWGSVSDIMLEGETEGSEKWKALKISQAVITTIHGALSAFMSGFNSGVPAPWNIALGISTAAAAAATGAAEISKIKNTQMGSGNSSISGISASSGAGVEPLLNEQYDLQRLTNLSLQSDDFLPGKTQVYVLESDIQEVGTRVQVRENNATF